MINRVVLVALLLFSAFAFRSDAPFWPASGKATYIASFGALTCNQINLLTIEATATQGFQLVGWCANISPATAAAAVNTTVRRESSPATGGTVLVSEAVGATSISAMSPADPPYPGIARGGAATTGTAGATLDQVGFSIGELGAGTADPPGNNPFCKYYGVAGEKLPTVARGVNNGIVLTVSSAGAGALASCAITATIVTTQ